MTRALLALAVALAACGDDGGDVAIDAPVVVDVPDDAVPDEVIMQTVTLDVTEVVEFIMEGGPGDYARITATVTTPPSPSLDWNIHGHAGGETQIVSEELRVMQMDYLFQPTAAADWYLLLRNKGQTNIELDFKVELFGNWVWKDRQ